MQQAARDVRGRIFDIQRFSINDGPGIRTTVFLKGCPLRCLWCHNPEGISSEPALSFDPAKCIGCGACLRVCPQQAHRMEGDRHVLDRERCTVCGACAEQCYAGALEIVGREIAAGEAVDEVLRDRPFYQTSGGGMTLSGGEPAYQIDFTMALLSLAKAEGLHNAVETCGFAPAETFDRLLEATDLFLFDLKAGSDERHRELTGVPLRPILAALRRLHDAGATIWLRLPMIPTLNVTDAFFRTIAETVGDLPGIRKVQLLPYHPLGAGKHARLGQTSPMPAELRTPDKEKVQAWLDRLTSLGVTAVAL